MTQSIQDWVVELGFDDTEFLAGAKRVEKTLQKLAKMQDKLSGTTASQTPSMSRKPTAKEETRLVREEKALRKINTLEAKRLQLRRAIIKAEAIGLKPGRKFAPSLRGKSTAKIEKARLELEKLITLEKKKQAGIAAKEATKKSVTPPAPQKKGFQLADDKQLKIANTIESVVRRAERGLGATSKEFKTINREANNLKKSISDVSSSSGLERLNNQIRILRERTTAATAATRKQTSAMNAQKFAAQGLNDSLRNLGRSYVSVFAAAEGGRAFLNTGAQFDSLNASLLAASGSTEQAAKDFEFIKDTSIRLGVQLSEAANGYRQIGAAGRFSSLTMEQTNEVFLAATEASRAFGLSADRAGLVYLAFSQILSKGKVSQEELRRQLGEQLPGVMAIAAKAMKVTTGELESMIKAGISAEEFLPKFSKELRSAVTDSGALAASLKSITAAQQRFSSTIQLLTIESFDVGAKEGVVFFFGQLTKTAKGLQPLFRLVGKAVGLLAKGLGGVLRVATAISRPFTTILDILTDIIPVFADSTLMADGYTSSLQHLIRAFKFLAGVMLIPLALAERLSNTFEKLRSDLKFDSPSEIVKSLNIVVSEGALSALKTFGIDLKAESAANRANESTGTTTVNSGNNLTLNVNGATEDPDSIISAVEDWWNNTMSAGN